MFEAKREILRLEIFGMLQMYFVRLFLIYSGGNSRFVIFFSKNHLKIYFKKIKNLNDKMTLVNIQTLNFKVMFGVRVTLSSKSNF